MSQIGSTQCSACGFERARVNEGKNGTLSIACSECGTTAFVKSPNAVAKLRARLGQSGEPKPPAPPAPKKKSDPPPPAEDDFAKKVFG